jgi:hypothetical protein
MCAVCLPHIPSLQVRAFENIMRGSFNRFGRFADCCLGHCMSQVLSNPNSFDVAVTTYEMVNSADFGRPIQTSIVSSTVLHS